VALHLNARRISKTMGLTSNFFLRPSPLGQRVDVTDDRLPAVGDVDVLDRHLLSRSSRRPVSWPAELSPFEPALASSSQ
jgi:hypothetical protein